MHSSEIPRDSRLRDAAAPYAARTKAFYRTLSATSIGIELAVAVLLGALTGWWIDGKLGTTPWAMLFFLVLGCIAGMRGVMRYVRQDARETGGGS
jgi:F0F1-type ATP synthase assembly protein I